MVLLIVLGVIITFELGFLIYWLIDKSEYFEIFLNRIDEIWFSLNPQAKELVNMLNEHTKNKKEK